MYCARCRKWNEEPRLFCAFCGEPLETDDLPAAAAAPGDDDRPESREAMSAEPPGRTESPPPEDPFALGDQGHVPVLNRAEPLRMDGGRAARTVIPRRDTSVDGDNLFLDGEEPGLEDEYDGRAVRRAEKKRAQAYEEAERGGFLARHIRGIVSLSLLVMVAIVVAMWAGSRGGQRTLAQLNLSRRPESYARLAENYARGGSREMEGYYYGRALRFDPDNVNYAVLMANAYIASGNTAKATEALKKVIELQPGNADAYALLASLYPVVATRPDDVRAIIADGYRRTGDSRLSQ